MDDEEYRIVDDEPETPKRMPKAYIILVKKSVVDTKRYAELMEKYRSKKQ